jgi:lysophospholipase L1-like esterase
MRGTVSLVLAAALAMAGCDADRQQTGGGAPHRVDRYVAMGDSYTAGSGIGSPVSDAGAGCGQTTKNYPRLVAEKLGAELADASCAGASTGNSFTNQTVNGDQVWPAQLNFLDDETDLVTVSFGYNDFAFFTDALLSCVSAVAGSPLATACANAGEGTSTDTALLAEELGARLERVLVQVEKRSPDALVLVVGYPQLVPASGSCDELSLIEGSYEEAAARLGLLDDAMREAAEDAGAGFVDVFGASKGHDVCAGDEAWVNGPDPAPGLALPLHPFQREQDAVARLIEDAVTGS